MILLEMALGDQSSRAKQFGPGRKKSGASSRTPYVVIYREHYIIDNKIVKSYFGISGNFFG
jgi:hypothetical protein